MTHRRPAQLYVNQWITIEQEIADIPWLKIFARQQAREMSDCCDDTRQEIMRVLMLLEKAMLKTFQPEKINIASFANYVPQVHWHIMARFRDDSHFPEPMWGVQQRQSAPHLEGMTSFINELPALLG